jgi:hypothetical protein
MKLRSLFASACSLLVSGQLVVLAQTTTYDVSRDFSIAANPNGVWS